MNTPTSGNAIAPLNQSISTPQYAVNSINSMLNQQQQSQPPPTAGQMGSSGPNSVQSDATGGGGGNSHSPSILQPQQRQQNTTLQVQNAAAAAAHFQLAAAVAGNNLPISIQPQPQQQQQHHQQSILMPKTSQYIPIHISPSVANTSSNNAGGLLTDQSGGAATATVAFIAQQQQQQQQSFSNRLPQTPYTPLGSAAGTVGVPPSVVGIAPINSGVISAAAVNAVNAVNQHHLIGGGGGLVAGVGLVGTAPTSVIGATAPGSNLAIGGGGGGGGGLPAMISGVPSLGTPGGGMLVSGAAASNPGTGAPNSTAAAPPASGQPVPQLQNIVCTVNLGVRLNLQEIALQSRNAEFNPKRFAAVIMRIREPRTTALIFSSGKMVCTGAKSEDDAKTAARKYARIIQKLGFEAKFMGFKIQNMVGSCDVKFMIRLEAISVTHTRYATYEPELFPGLIYRMAKPKIVLLIFVSGKIVLTGAKVREEIYSAFEKIYPILKSFQKAGTGVGAVGTPGGGPIGSVGMGGMTPMLTPQHSNIRVD